MKQTMHSMGSHGATVTEAETKQELEDNYHAMLEAAKQVESELKQHGVVAHDHHMPVPSSNTHEYTAPTSTIPTSRVLVDDDLTPPDAGEA